MLRILIALTASLSLVNASLMLSAPAAAADATGAQVSGSVVAADNGLAISNATVSLIQGSRQVATTNSDSAGHYAFSGVQPGIYSIRIVAEGRQTTRVDNIVISPGESETISTPLAIARTGSGELREIGRTTSAARASDTLAATATIQHNLDPLQIQDQGFFTGGQALETLPGVNAVGSPHSVGDDTYLDIRGAGPSETRALLDGHPIGPGGSIGYNANPQNYVYDYSNSPFQLLNNIQVTVGSGATGLYGVTAIGGTIDFQTLQPTKTTHAEVDQQAGGWGTSGTLVKATGSFGNLGYALGYTVNGTFGDFGPQSIFQSARPNNSFNANNAFACTPLASYNPNGYPDISSCNAALNTYPVSGNFLVKTNLEKLKYNFTPSTALTLTTYFSNEVADSTGNGDNDNVPYDTRLAAVNGNGNAGTGGCAANLYPVITDGPVTPGLPNACVTAQQLAQATSGPDGGGQLRSRGVRLYDYDALFTTALGINNITVDAYADWYQYHKESDVSLGLDPSGSYYVGNSFSNVYNTHGVLISDDLILGPNDVGVGWFNYHQLFNGNTYGTNGYPTFTDPAWSPYPDIGTGQYSFFLREAYTPTTSPFSAFLNAWSTYSNVTNQTVFDPRLSLVYKPTGRDVIRLTGGRADGFPNASLKYGSVQDIGANQASLNSCPTAATPYAIASSSNSNLTSEQATDVEASYGHRFWSDTSMNVVGYVSSVKNQLFSTTAPLSALPASIVNDPIVQGELNTFIPKLAPPLCGSALSVSQAEQVLGVQTTINIASALYRGIELQGRVRANPRLYLDYSYQWATAQQFGVPDYILATNPFVINGAQIYEVPQNKGQFALDYQDPVGLEAQLGATYIGNNNTYNRPAFMYFNGFVSQNVGKNLSLVVSCANCFNQDVQVYGYFGHQVYAGTNSFFSYDNSIDQANGLGYSAQVEEIGLPPAVFSATVKLRI